MDNRREFANSANGDRWLLARDDATGVAYVVHESNQSASGAVTRIEIAKFLNSGPHHPQHQALLELIGTLVDDNASRAAG
jgi:hypothetical protein